MQEAHLLAPDIDLSAEFVTTIWRNDATSAANVATNDATSIVNDATLIANDATSPLQQNKLLIDKIVASKISPDCQSASTSSLAPDAIRSSSVH